MLRGKKISVMRVWHCAMRLPHNAPQCVAGAGRGGSDQRWISPGSGDRPDRRSHAG